MYDVQKPKVEDFTDISFLVGRSRPTGVSMDPAHVFRVNACATKGTSRSHKNWQVYVCFVFNMKKCPYQTLASRS
jgi:hypothetical protein